MDRGLCQECGHGFSDEEWDNRHSDAQGQDVHHRCCSLCEELEKHLF